jgi:5-methyltetrahydrofolate corrinoid/iron sulfur protein methyltransferase
MQIIGENIHIISPRVKEAMAQQDLRFFQDLAVRQVEGGANVLDLNIGPQKKAGVEIMTWLVKGIQEVVDVPLSLDTTNLAAIEAGLKVAKTRCIVNSASAEEERLEAVPPLAKKYNAKLIALTMGKGSIPVSAEERVNIALEKLIPRAMELDIAMEDLLIDPLVLTVSGCQEYCPECVEAVRILKVAGDPPPMTNVGLTNVSNQVPYNMRPLINRTYWVMLMAAGVDYAIANPLDEQLKQFMRIVAERDDSTGVGRLVLTLYDKTVAMDKLTADDVDMDDPEQVAIFKTAQILYNDIIYTDSYLRV